MENRMMTDGNMKNFLAAVASSAPVPGGGGVCAYAAALGMSLGSMVANLTVGKKKYAEHEEEIRQILTRAAGVTERLAAGMDRDAEAFEPLSRAYGLPTGTEQEKAYKAEVMEAALQKAAKAPLELMEGILKAIEILERLAVIGSSIAVSDVGVGIELCRAALKSAALNVYINTKLMKDRGFAEEMNRKAKILSAEGARRAEQVYIQVEQRLCS